MPYTPAGSLPDVKFTAGRAERLMVVAVGKVGSPLRRKSKEMNTVAGGNDHATWWTWQNKVSERLLHAVLTAVAR